MSSYPSSAAEFALLVEARSRNIVVPLTPHEREAAYAQGRREAGIYPVLPKEEEREEAFLLRREEGFAIREAFEDARDAYKELQRQHNRVQREFFVLCKMQARARVPYRWADFVVWFIPRCPNFSDDALVLLESCAEEAARLAAAVGKAHVQILGHADFAYGYRTLAARKRHEGHARSTLKDAI